MEIEAKPDLDLVGLVEMQQMFGVEAQTVYRWRTRSVLPEPDWTVSGSPIWRREVILAWGVETGRKVTKGKRRPRAKK